MDNPYQSPLDPASQPSFRPGTERQNQRPTSATVFGVLNIIFGSIGLLCAPFALLLMFMDLPQGPTPNPALEALKDPGYRTIMMIMTPLGMIASAVLLASGIGLLGMKRWGPTLANGYAYYAIMAAVAGAFINYTYSIGPALAATRANPNPQAPITVVSGIIGVISSFLYPLLLHFFMSRPNIVRAYSQPPPKPPGKDWDFKMTRTEL